MKNLEKLAQQVSDGTLSVDKASLQIMETVYKNRKWFGLKKLQGDDLHDFMLFYYERSKAVFSFYKPELGSFENFLYVNINNALLAWYKTRAKRSCEESTLSMMDDIFYEESVKSYEKMDPASVCAAMDNDIPSINRILEMRKKDEKSYSMRRGRKIRNSRAGFAKTENLRKEACLVLLLKSCSFVSDSMIENAAAVCGKSFGEIKKLVEEAKRSIKSKKNRISRLEKTRDNFFYYKRKFTAEMERADVGSDTSMEIGAKIEKADAAWRIKNEQLHSENLRVPSNVTIGRLLGISDRHVRYVINQAQKNMDNITLKSYYVKYEDLLGKRKQEQKEGDAGAFS